MTVRQRGLTEQAATAAVDTACRLLRLSTICGQFPAIADAAEREQLTYRGFLAELLIAECEDRDRRRSERRIKAAGFPRSKWLKDFDFDANQHVEAATVNTLATSDWVRRGHPVCLIGDSGTGKSHLLIALGTEAAMAGFRVRYVLAAKLVNKLVEAADDKQLTKTIARYGRVDLLCIDELGYTELRQTRRRTAVPGPHRTRGEEQCRDRLQRVLLRLDQDLHRPEALRRDRRPTHLQRHHHRNRHRLLPPRPDPQPADQSRELTSTTLVRRAPPPADQGQIDPDPGPRKSAPALPTRPCGPLRPRQR
ncbi:IstB-like ATP binding protein [Actinoplanes regularis]|uniref:IstB-like ATP binding protein n=1 Tax=Actinoplanes regularis TaxID=52697 RepID=A0A239JJM2_9ACTN|nr:IstB-like ATP binding protein [Actinoplanes regularis]